MIIIIKIIHLLTTNKLSGAENVAITIIKNSKKNNQIYISPKGSIEDKLNLENVKFYGLNRFSIHEVVKACKQFNPDIIHSHDFTATIVACVIKLLKPRIKIVAHIHQDPKWIHEKSVKSLFVQFSKKFVNTFIIVNSNILENSLFSNYSNCLLLPNIVDVDDVHRKSSEFECKKYDFIFLGRLEAVKNPLLLIEILSKYKKYDKNFKCAVVGSGTLYDECKKNIASLGLNANIEMLGFKKNPYPYLNNSKVLLITSITEGLPIVVNEAICLGKPIISTDISSFSNINEDFLLISKNKDDFILNLQLIRSENVYKLLSKECFSFSKKHFQVRVYCEKVTQLYKKTLE